MPVVILARTSSTEAETRAAGRDLASRLRAGDTVSLVGALGAGKTAFVRGLAEGLGLPPSDVASPTFALVHDYGVGTGGLRLLHADLFRLRGLPGEREEVEALGLDDARREGAVLAIEWPDEALEGEDGYRVEIVVTPSGERLLRIQRVPAPRGVCLRRQ